MPGLSILFKILCVRQNDIRAQKLECLVEYFSHSRQLPTLKDVRAIHDDLEPWRLHLVKQCPSFAHGINCISNFGFDAERYLVSFSDAHSLFYLYEDICPRFR